jgi:hypothetical protein
VIFLQHACENGNSAAAMGRIVLDVATAAPHKDRPIISESHWVCQRGAFAMTKRNIDAGGSFSVRNTPGSVKKSALLSTSALVGGVMCGFAMATGIAASVEVSI